MTRDRTLAREDPRTLRFGSVAFSLPSEGWYPRRAGGLDALLVAEDRDHGFRPTVAVASRPAEGTAAERVQALLTVLAAAGPVLAVEPFPQGGPNGRRVEGLHVTASRVVRSTVWTATAAGRQIEVTVSRPLVGSAAVFQAVDLLQQTMVLDDVDCTPEPMALEWPERQPWPSSPWAPLSRAAWAVLWRSRGHGFQPAIARSPEGAVLREAGLMNRFGGTTPDAERALRIVAVGRSSTVRRRSAGGDELWSVWAADGEATIDVGTVAGDPPAVVTHRFEHGHPDDAAARLIDWMDVRPTAASGTDERADPPGEAVAARLLGPEPAPAGLGPALAAAWAAGEWAAFDIAPGGLPGRVRVLRAGDGTWWHQDPVDSTGRTPVRALPASMLLDLLTGGGRFAW